MSGIPETVIVDKFGLRGKHIAAPDEHVSDMAVAAAERLLRESGVDPGARRRRHVLRGGSCWKDYAVWQAAPWIAHRLRCRNAYAIEYDNVSMGTPAALRAARALLASEPHWREVAPRRRLPRVLPPRLRKRALPLHVQLRGRRGCGVARRGREPQRAPLAHTRSPTARSPCKSRCPQEAPPSPHRPARSVNAATSSTSPTRRR